MSKLTSLILKIIGFIPLPVLHLKSNFLSFFLRRIFAYRTDVVRENLKNSFPNKSERELKLIEKLSYRNFTDVILENLLLFTISKKNLNRRMKLLNPEVFESLHNNNKGAILISAHYNNWEWMALSLALYAKQDVYSVYKPLSNKSIDRVMLRARSRFGAKIIPMASFPKAILQNKGKATINLILADQSPHKGKLDFYCDFLNQDTPVFLGPEKLMKAADLELLFVEVHRVKRGYYEMKIVSLADKVLNEKGATTLLHVKHLEQVIKNNPENWLWSHRRWKHSRKK
jgi:KDO2-lipid IV(A) lauroyltransferase